LFPPWAQKSRKFRTVAAAEGDLSGINPVAQNAPPKRKGPEMALAIRKTLEVPANDVFPEEHSCSQTIVSLIQQYDYVEKLCEVAIGQQEDISRQFYATQHTGIAPDKDLVEVKSGDMRPRADMSISDISFKDFQQLHRLAQTVVPNGLPNASRRFVLNACTPAFVEIEDLEEMIKLYRYRMSIIEQDILDHTPTSSAEAVTKLKFMSSLMLDGGNLEVDFFAYLVEECAFVIANNLRHP
jgi:hypothetical protein